MGEDLYETKSLASDSVFEKDCETAAKEKVLEIVSNLGEALKERVKREVYIELIK